MNVLTVTGHLIANPARRDTAKGVVCDFLIAVDGQRRLRLSVTCWGHLAGACKRYLTVGRRVAVTGQLCVDEYLSGCEPRLRWYLRGEHVTFLDKRPGDVARDDDTAGDRNAAAVTGSDS